VLGWFIIVRRAGSPEGLRATVDTNVLATWETSLGGLDWLEDLERKGQATCMSRNGYPTRFTVVADAVLPMLRLGRPPRHSGIEVIGDDYITPAGWSGELKFHVERIGECPSDDPLTIDAWDQS
jgi:hypothetical protein